MGRIFFGGGTFGGGGGKKNRNLSTIEFRYSNGRGGHKHKKKQNTGDLDDGFSGGVCKEKGPGSRRLPGPAENLNPKLITRD